MRKPSPTKKISAAALKKALGSLPKNAFTPSTGTPTNKPFSARDLDKFSELIHAFREESVRELEELGDELRAMASNEGSDDNSYSLHMAEQGTDAMEREKTFMQAQRTSDYIKKLDEALLRIQYKTFGICRICGLRLDSRRLMAVPVTQVCTVYKNTSKPCQPGKEFLANFGEEEE
jgi:RNA polymerase-binding transcription factor DksA